MERNNRLNPNDPELLSYSPEEARIILKRVLEGDNRPCSDKDLPEQALKILKAYPYYVEPHSRRVTALISLMDREESGIPKDYFEDVRVYDGFNFGKVDPSKFERHFDGDPNTYYSFMEVLRAMRAKW